MAIEKELKLVLSELEYNLLVSHLNENAALKNTKQQKNYYLDTRNFVILHAQEMLRVREANGVFVLTLKRNAKAVNGYFSCEEIEHQLEAKNCDSAILEAYNHIPDLPEDLYNIGVLENKRFVYEWKSFKLEIDQTVFSKDRIDFELECETEDIDALQSELRELFSDLRINWIEQKTTKFRRFLEFNEFPLAAKTI
jgi:uncharacterized protein YjbK